MRFALFLALAHLRRRPLQTALALLGVGVGVAVLLAALSLTNGFVSGLVRATLKAYPHLVLFSLGQDLPPLPPHPEVEGAAPFAATKALLTRPAEGARGPGVDFATLVGLGEGGEALYPELGLRLEPGGIYLGSALVQSLGVVVGERIYAMSATQERLTLRVLGSFRTGNYLLDSGYAFVDLKTLERLSGLRAQGYQVRLKDPWRAREVGFELAGTRFFPQAWQDTQRTLLEQLALQKQVLGILIFLIVAVAALGVANLLVLKVVEKTPEIALLRAMGASRLTVGLVFALEGVFLGVGGVGLGNLLGYALGLYLSLRPVPLPGELYFLTHLPVEMRLADFLAVSGASLVATLLSALLPLWRALQVQPGVVLR
ncbi:MAG: FtsX-like permease family protein [Thermus sp.]|uniref:ABC transporter permease n=1 Tax=Thermus sp. TaxID=275 RepID=UPI0025D7B77B|nr:FtsX-like permease family protein [Thermus sp.]MCS6867119.1 ABC transporter permease [Thermus sp.]MDW8017838.1 FtsX-like permease family protein [Thermus sp.]MDW8358195.1 FtsX-like permease family protein [Thermus sp.]